MKKKYVIKRTYIKYYGSFYVVCFTNHPELDGSGFDTPEDAKKYAERQILKGVQE